MFGIIRLIIGGIFYCSLIAVIKKTNVIYKRTIHIIFVSISIALITLLAFFPFENIFITFKSPKSAYEYFSFGKSNIKLIVSGNESDLVIDSKNDLYKYLIVPKTSKGWKVGIGLNTKRILSKYSNGISVYVYQYKNTNDYFITIFDTNGGELEVSDDYDTKFYSLEKKNDFIEKTFVTYYAHISDFNSQYNVSVNGNKITLQN